MNDIPTKEIYQSIYIQQDNNGKKVAGVLYRHVGGSELVVPRNGEHVEFKDEVQGITLQGYVTRVQHKHLLDTNYINQVTYVHIE